MNANIKTKKDKKPFAEELLAKYPEYLLDEGFTAVPNIILNYGYMVDMTIYDIAIYTQIKSYHPNSNIDTDKLCAALQVSKKTMDRFRKKWTTKFNESGVKYLKLSVDQRRHISDNFENNYSKHGCRYDFSVMENEIYLIYKKETDKKSDNVFQINEGFRQVMYNSDIFANAGKLLSEGLSVQNVDSQSRGRTNSPEIGLTVQGKDSQSEKRTESPYNIQDIKQDIKQDNNNIFTRELLDYKNNTIATQWYDGEPPEIFEEKKEMQINSKASEENVEYANLHAYANTIPGINSEDILQFIKDMRLEDKNKYGYVKYIVNNYSPECVNVVLKDIKIKYTKKEISYYNPTYVNKALELVKEEEMIRMDPFFKTFCRDQFGEDLGKKVYDFYKKILSPKQVNDKLRADHIKNARLAHHDQRFFRMMDVIIRHYTEKTMLKEKLTLKYFTNLLDFDKRGAGNKFKQNPKEEIVKEEAVIVEPVEAPAKMVLGTYYPERGHVADKMYNASNHYIFDFDLICECGETVTTYTTDDEGYYIKPTHCPNAKCQKRIDWPEVSSKARSYVYEMQRKEKEDAKNNK